MLENLGLVLALAVLIVMALRGINVIFASLVSSLLIIATNQLPLAESFSQYYSFGPLGAFTFAGKFFLLFVCGAIFGRVMGESHAAASIAIVLSRKLGPHRALLIAALASAMLTYGGVVVFIVIFAIYPLGLRLLQEADIPKRLLLAAIALGSGTFTLTALPGTPSVQNVISSVALGTDLFAGAIYGIIATFVMLGCGLWYLESERLKAIRNGEKFVPAPGEITQTDDSDEEMPHWFLALIPLVTVLLAIIIPRLLVDSVTDMSAGSSVAALITFANAQPIIWPSIALLIGSVCCVILFPVLRRHPVQSLSKGAEDAIMPLLNTAAVIGFGGIVTQTEGFQQFTNAIMQVDLPPLISMFVSVSLTSALVGSSSGGLQIFMETMAQDYLAMGISAGELHRLATMASGGFDSLPHCGAVVAMLTITRQTHREAYKDLAVITVAIPVLATLVAMASTLVV
ncbi:MAG: GntP family permease [Candidatus Pelagadaptatus aseana]|uniref:GntP family permease n=1 Tax=Candidatus Pelagadaptatus aseana TaxID=3120508 RepID=UPI0039B1517F